MSTEEERHRHPDFTWSEACQLILWSAQWLVLYQKRGIWKPLNYAVLGTLTLSLSSKLSLKVKAVFWKPGVCRESPIRPAMVLAKRGPEFYCIAELRKCCKYGRSKLLCSVMAEFKLLHYSISFRGGEFNYRFQCSNRCCGGAIEVSGLPRKSSNIVYSIHFLQITQTYVHTGYIIEF